MGLLRNDKEKELVRLGHKHTHHSEACLVENWGIDYTDQSWADMPIRALWCASHGQWLYETPVEVVWKFGDGYSTMVRKRR